jgi:hypothetical protein
VDGGVVVFSSELDDLKVEAGASTTCPFLPTPVPELDASARSELFDDDDALGFICIIFLLRVGGGGSTYSCFACCPPLLARLLLAAPRAADLAAILGDGDGRDSRPSSDADIAAGGSSNEATVERASAASCCVAGEVLAAISVEGAGVGRPANVMAEDILGPDMLSPKYSSMQKVPICDGYVV